MSENSVYIITPPDMQLLNQGPTITALSSDPLFVNSVETVNENIFKTVPINLYHPDGDVDESNIAWIISVMRLSDTVFVDLDTVNEAGLIAALACDTNLVLINQRDTKPLVLKILNSLQEFTIYNSPEEYMEMVVARII